MLGDYCLHLLQRVLGFQAQLGEWDQSELEVSLHSAR